MLAVLAEFHTRRAQLLSRTVKHVVSTFPQDLPVPLVQQVLLPGIGVSLEPRTRSLPLQLAIGVWRHSPVHAS